MNIKEAFRLQKKYMDLAYEAKSSISNRDHAMNVTKRHLRKARNPEAEDFTEEVVPDDPFFPNDNVIRFMTWLIRERMSLSVAINKAKASADFDIDAAIETNKFRQMLYGSVRQMLNQHAKKTVSTGKDFKFSVDGCQVPYYYDVEVETTEAFDRAFAAQVMKETIQEADRVSAEIDAAMINIQVDYTPPFDVNCTFEEVMEMMADMPSNA